MKEQFVLDEVVIICGITHSNPFGATDHVSSALIHEILSNRHALALDNPVWHRWTRQITALQRAKKPIDDAVVRVLTGFTFASGHVRFYQDSLPLLTETTWSSKLLDDKDFIRLAAQCRGVLSTLDGPLLDEIAKLKLDSEHGFTAKDVDGSISLASIPA